MGLRARLLLLVLLPAIPALLLAIYTDLQQRQYAVARVGKDALKLVELAAATQSGLLERVRSHFLAVSRYPQAYGTDFSTFEKFCVSACKMFPEYVDFGIAETNGMLISSAFGLRGETNLAEHLDFQRVVKAGALAVGELQPANALCKQSLRVGYPLVNEQGQVVRALYAAIDLSAVNQALSKTPIPPGALIELFDSTGYLVGRSADWQKWAGHSYCASPLFQTISSQGEGVAEMSGLDGQRRLYGFTTMRGKAGPNLFVTVGIPTAAAYAETQHVLLFNLAILAAVASLALLAAWIYADRNVLQPIGALLSTTHRVTSGDLSARTGIPYAPAEFQQLMKAFNEMATSLQLNRSKMEQVQAEIQRLNATLEGRVLERTAQLADMNRQLEGFSYSVSHDLRAPLRHIAAFLTLLQDELGAASSTEARRFFDNISQAVTRMNALVEDLLAFAKISREEIRRERVAMSELVTEVQSELKKDIEGRDIQWEIEPLPEVLVDRSMFKQVWVNLLANAVKYTRERDRAQISVGFRKWADEMVFYVRDNGAGFDMKYADKLFRVFQRLHAADRFEGTGVGLANVHRIVARHGGRTWAQGEVEQGATFWFSLPKAAEHLN